MVVEDLRAVFVRSHPREKASPGQGAALQWGVMATEKASISYPHVTKTPGVCGGKACIDGTRIRVNNLVFLHKDGANDAKIREAYPDLTPAQIHAPLAYYYDNREEIDAELAADEAWAESLR